MATDDSVFYDMIDLYKHPKHFGKLEEFDKSEEGNSSSCGDSFNVYIKMDGNKIKDVSFEGAGCVVSTVTLSLLCGYLRGKEIESAQNLGLDDLKKLIGIDHLSYSRVPCAMIGLEIVKKALKK